VSFATVPAACSTEKKKQDAGMVLQLLHSECVSINLLAVSVLFFSFFFPTCFSDLQRLGELQSELAGMADFTATYLQCQLLLIKV